MRRREFLGLLAPPTMAALGGCRSAFSAAGGPHHALLFTSAGKTCFIRPGESKPRVLEFHHPGQATWQPGPMFDDGRRMILLSMEPRRDGPGRPFDEYYTQTPTHVWAYDWATGKLDELATRERRAVFYTPQLLIRDERILMQVVRGKAGQILSMNLDGSDAVEFTRAGEGLPYGFSLSPDGTRVAFHLASPKGYQIWTSDVLGRDRKLIRADPDHLYFAPAWSPDGEWLLYQDCVFKTDPGHDGSDAWISRRDGSEHRQLTDGQSLWFAATYGGPSNKGSGSNVPAWTGDGRILASRRLPGSKVPWEFQAGRVDTDHFNRDWKPELARGGAEIVEIDPVTRSARSLTPTDPPQWDFRNAVSSDQRWISFCRCGVGEAPALWIMDRDGKHPRRMTRGIEDRGADHPRWIALKAAPRFP